MAGQNKNSKLKSLFDRINKTASSVTDDPEFIEGEVEDTAEDSIPEDETNDNDELEKILSDIEESEEELPEEDEEDKENTKNEKKAFVKMLIRENGLRPDISKVASHVSGIVLKELISK